MRGHHCEKDVAIKVAAFANHLESNANEGTLTTENVELLTKFGSFLQEEKHKRRHGWDGHGHGKFGKHGHHGMFGHLFGKHGLHARHRHGPYGHGPRRHGPHGHGPHGHGPHGHGPPHHGPPHHGRPHHGPPHHGPPHHGPPHHGPHGPPFHGHGKHEMHGCEFRKHTDLEEQYEMGKHFWKYFAMYKMSDPEETIVIEDECVESGPPPLQKETTEDSEPGPCEENNGKCVSEHKDHHCGRRANEWVIVRKPAKDQGSSQNTAEATTQAAPQADTSVPPQELATMVGNITIESTAENE